MSAHYFAFSRNWTPEGKRRCGECDLPYDDGEHIEITALKPYTQYVCPESSGRTGGYGHSSIWTGAYLPQLRTLRDHLCTCGREFIEEDSEQWLLEFEVLSPFNQQWSKVSVVRSKHAALQQQAGLLQGIDQGEPIRNVDLRQVS